MFRTRSRRGLLVRAATVALGAGVIMAGSSLSAKAGTAATQCNLAGTYTGPLSFSVATHQGPVTLSGTATITVVCQNEDAQGAQPGNNDGGGFNWTLTLTGLPGGTATASGTGTECTNPNDVVYSGKGSDPTFGKFTVNSSTSSCKATTSSTPSQSTYTLWNGAGSDATVNAAIAYQSGLTGTARANVENPSNQPPIAQI